MASNRPPWTPHPPEKVYLLKKHGITPKEWWDLFKAQGDGCAICGLMGRKLYVDHHHLMGDAGLVRGSVRGLLCWICNSGIQAFRENAYGLKKAALYLENPPAWRLWPDERRETE
jgi:hypothetical protein